MATSTRLTIEDFERLPQDEADYRELVDGELVDVSGNTPNHICLRDYLLELLRPFARRNKLGLVMAEQEFDFGGNAHGPDLSLLGPDQAPRLNRSVRVQRFVPDMAIEIVSRNDKFAEIAKKAKRYRACGTKEVWAFSIETREAYWYLEAVSLILGENDQFAPATIPGFSIRIGELFDQA